MEPLALRALIVDDNPGDARLVELTLSKEPGVTIRCERAPRVSVAVERVARGDIDVVLLDLGLPDSQGTEGLHRIRAAAPQVAVIVLSGTDNPATALSAVAAGAQDYLVKGIFPPGYLGRTLRLAVVIRAMEVGLENERPIPAESLDELDASHIGAALLAPHGVTQSNASFGQLTGFSAVGSATEYPDWMRTLLGPVAGGRAAPVPLDVGEFSIAGPSGPGPALEYSLRRFPSLPVPRSLLLVRSAAPHRRASHREGRHAAGRREPGERVVLDRATWENLRELAGADTTFLPSLVASFRAEGRRLAGTLQSATDEVDTARIARIAHTLKSACAQVGALDLARKCRALESQAETGNLPETRALVLEIARGYADVAELLSKRYPAPP